MTCYVSILCIVLYFGAPVFVDAQIPVPSSGFLEEYPPLSPLEKHPQVLAWRASDLDVKYESVLFDPPLIFIDPESKYKGIRPDELKVLSDELRDMLAMKSAEGGRLAAGPGPGVGRVRLALTNVQLIRDRGHGWGQQTASPETYTLRAAAGRNVSLSKATIEVEFTDSVTGRRLGFLLVNPGQLEVRNSHLSEQLNSWSDLLRTLENLGEAARAMFADILVGEPSDK